MSTHVLQPWSQYLSADAYELLICYVENVKNGIPNDHMLILCGPGRTGKTVLMNEVTEYLGDDVCGPVPVSMKDIIFSEHIQRLGLLEGLEEMYGSKKTVNAIVNLIRYKQSFIAAICDLDKVPQKILEHSQVIHMTHVF
jgi:Cdc6-like AAA superfamily ATPase